jgi:hypothetical protein
MFLRIVISDKNKNYPVVHAYLSDNPVQAAESVSLNGLNRLRQTSPMDASEFLMFNI